MPEYPVALFDAFSEKAFGGSIAGVVADAGGLTADEMLRIAREIGAPATGFITEIDDQGVDVRFFSTMTEYPMCGHGTMGLMTWLVQRGWFVPDVERPVTAELRTPAVTSAVELRRRTDDRIEVMLTLVPAEFEDSVLSAADLAPLLGIEIDGFVSEPAMSVATTDFRSLLVPVRNLADMEAVTPDFTAIAALCRRVTIDTIALFTDQPVQPVKTIRCREFCPAVGTPESPASGTTNRAIACYLHRHGLLGSVCDSRQTLHTEQGYEMGRPSQIVTELSLRDGQPAEVSVGGLASKSMEGTFYLP